MVNDVSGLLADPLMEEVFAKTDCGVIVMHMRYPQTMQADPHYADVVHEVREFFDARLQSLVERGISTNGLMFDPGIGFGKTTEHNLSLLSHLK